MLKPITYSPPNICEAAYHHPGTSDRALLPQQVDRNFKDLSAFCYSVYDHVCNVELELHRHTQATEKLQSFMTWLAEQHPDVLDEFTNTVDVAKKLDDNREIQMQL